ncbi:MAG: DUF1036 domain-containing protein, partial [Oricola sp.]|nr:DUF1036 domain-containing protein [Oricola sp.]
EPGECAKIIKGALEKDHYYVYGLIEDPAGDRTISGGDKSFCVNLVMFSTRNDLSCADQELEEAQFRRIEIGGAESTTFDFTPDLFAPAAARAAVNTPTQ